MRVRYGGGTTDWRVCIEIHVEGSDPGYAEDLAYTAMVSVCTKQYVRKRIHRWSRKPIILGYVQTTTYAKRIPEASKKVMRALEYLRPRSGPQLTIRQTG